MSLYRNPQDHAAHPPEGWVIFKTSGGRWELIDQDGTTMQSFPRKRDAEQAAVSGPYVRLYREEGRWYAGDTPPGWRTWEDVAREQRDRADRAAQRAAQEPTSRD